jgi:CRP-like cAMP-binding protein
VKLLPNGVACRKGENGDAMFMVLEGEVRARVMIDGRESTLKVLEVGECFGELAVIDESPRSADVVANKETVLLKISAAALKKLFAEAPALAAPFLLGLSKTLTGRIRHISKRYEDSIHFTRAAHGEQ